MAQLISGGVSGGVDGGAGRVDVGGCCGAALANLRMVLVRCLVHCLINVRGIPAHR